MQLMRLAEVPTTERDKVFSYSRSHALIGTAILLSATVGLTLFGQSKHFWLGYYVAAVTLLFFFIFRKLVTARFRPSNWLVRVTDEGLYIKFRSYLNDHFPEQDLTVVLIPYQEMRSARLVRQEQEIPDRNESGKTTITSRRQTQIELELAGDTKGLVDALGRERDQVIAGKSLGRTKSRYRHLPARLAAADRLQIEWNVVPSAQTLLDYLSRHTLVQPEEQRRLDFGDLANLTQAEQESRLLQMAESGDKIGAISLARNLYSYDLAAAKEFVEGLAGKRSGN